MGVALARAPELANPGRWGWGKWWDRAGPTFTRQQVEGLWRSLDRLCLVEVVELALDQPLTAGPAASGG